MERRQAATMPTEAPAQHLSPLLFNYKEPPPAEGSDALSALSLQAPHQFLSPSCGCRKVNTVHYSWVILALPSTRLTKTGSSTSTDAIHSDAISTKKM